MVWFARSYVSASLLIVGGVYMTVMVNTMQSATQIDDEISMATLPWHNDAPNRDGLRSQEEEEERQQTLITQQTQQLVTNSKTIVPSTDAANFPSVSPVATVNLRVATATTTEDYTVVDCVKVRGEFGEWVHDYEIAKATQYRPLMGFRQANHMARQQKIQKREGANYTATFLPQTMSAWRETRYPQCNLNLLTRAGFCSVMQDRSIEHFFLVGDSMTQAMHVSFLGLMGITGVDAKEWLTSPRRNPLVKQRIDCSEDFSFQLVSVRSALFAIDRPPNATSVSVDFESNRIDVAPGYGQMVIFMCYTKLQDRARPCPWMEELREAKGRALVIVNGGASYHAESTFGAMLDGFLDSLDALGRKDDVVWFRSVSPGHPNCFNSSSAIIRDYDGFEKHYKTSRFSWDKFELYNEYVKRRIEERRGQAGAVPMEFLNVYNMTALRPDGHSAKTDCLHYEHPGPIDWWNHLMYTNLVDLAFRETEPTALQTNDRVL